MTGFAFRSCLATLTAGLIMFTSAALPAAEVTIPFIRKAGQEYSLTIRKTTYRSRPGRPVVGGTTFTPIKVKVVGAFKGGYVLEWTTGEVLFEERAANAEKSALHKMLAKEIKGMRIRFRVDSAGTAKEILNKTEIALRYRRMVARLYEWTHKKGMGTSPDKFKQFLPPGTLSAQGVQDQALEDYNLMNQLLATTLPLDKTMRRNVELPSIFPGTKVPAVVTSSKKAWNAKTGILDYRVHVEYNRAVLNRMLAEFTRRQFRVLGKPIPPNFKLPPASVEQTVDYRIETKRGFATRVLYIKEIRIQGAVRRNTTEILLQAPTN